VEAPGAAADFFGGRWAEGREYPRRALVVRCVAARADFSLMSAHPGGRVTHQVPGVFPGASARLSISSV
jgi:hypothetical protein